MDMLVHKMLTATKSGLAWYLQQEKALEILMAPSTSAKRKGFSHSLTYLHYEQGRGTCPS